MVICYINRKVVRLWLERTAGTSPTATSLQGVPLWRVTASVLLELDFKGRPEITQPGSPALSSDTVRQVPCPLHHQQADCIWPCTSFWAELGFGGSSGSWGREGEGAAHPHTLQVVDCCWLWFPWKALKWLSEHFLLGLYILWQGSHDPGGVASKPHPLGCFMGCSAAWHRDSGLRGLLPPKPITQEVFGLSCLSLGWKSLSSLLLWKGVLGTVILNLTPAKLSPQVPKAKNKR